MARKKKSSTEDVAEAVAEVAEAVAAVAAVVDGPTVAEVAHAIEEIGEAVTAVSVSVEAVAPGMPGGFARVRKAKAAAREEKRRELARAALDRKQRDRAQSHFEKRAHKETLAQSAVDRAQAFIRENTPKTTGRRLSKLDNAKRHNALERARQRGIQHKLRQMQRLVRFVEANPPAAPSAPVEAVEPDTQD